MRSLLRPAVPAVAAFLLAGVRLAAVPQPAAGRLLVARAGLPDPNFAASVVLLVEANDRGAWGLIVNRPTELELGRILPEPGAFRGRADVLHFGGPVDGRKVFALVRTDAPPEDSLAVLPGVSLVWSLQAVDALARQGRPCRVFAGYSGWGAGQLDAEIGRGDWQVTDADASLLFERDGALMWEILNRRTGSLVVEAAAPRPGG